MSNIKQQWKFETKEGAKVFIKKILEERKPKMLFSVIGDSDSFVPKPWPKSIFQSALITAAKNAGDSWIFYEGKDKGVSAVVYDALEEYDRIEFYNYKGERLERCEDTPEQPNNRIKNTTSAPLLKLIGIKPDPVLPEDEKDEKISSDKSEGDHHYNGKEIFIDLLIKYSSDNTEKEHKTFLVELEKTISSEKRSFFEGFDMRIPVLIVVVEGDLQTISHVELALRSGLPVLIVKGTGKAADLIVECSQEDDDNMRAKLLKKRAPILFGTSFDRNNFERLRTMIEYIAGHLWLINVFDIDTDDPVKMSQIAGEAVTRAWAMEQVQTDETKKTKTDTDSDNKPTTSTNNKPAGVHGESNVSVTLQISSMDAKGDHKSSSTDAEQKDQYSPVVTDSSNKDVPDAVKYIPEKTTSDESRRYVLSSEFNSPSSLPLYFYFAYQMLQEERKRNLQKNNKGESQQSPVDIDENRLLLEALKANRTDYVQVLLDQGEDFCEQHFPILYRTTVKCESCSLEDDEKCLHMQWILKQAHWESTEVLIGEKDTNNNASDESTRVRESAKRLCRILLGYKDIGYKDIGSECKNNRIKDIPKETPKNEIMADLLLWSVFANRPEIAEIMWKKTDNQLLSGIVCAVVLNKLAKKADNVKEQHFSNSLKKHSMIFENRCMMMMDNMYELDPKVATKIFKSDVLVWGIKTSPKTFSYENFKYDFIAHPCSQKLLNRTWYNKLAPDFKPFLGSIGRKPVKFMKAPFTKFLLHYIFFASMLVTYSSYVMTSIDNVNYERFIARLWEYYTYFWALGDCFEEIKSGLGILDTGDLSHRGFWSRLKRYLNDFWNAVDVLSYILLIVALFVRHLMPSEDYNAARRLFSLSLLVMYLRFLQIFLMHRRLGPTLIMIKQMLKDLAYFLYIAIVVIVGVGVYYHANLFPNHLAIFGPGSYETWSVWKIFYYPYWQLYGETFNEFLEGKDLSDCISNMTEWNLDQSQERCPQEEWSVSVVSAFYMLISNLLLVNLVIAMFSYTFDRVQTNSEKLWRFERYTVITDYESKLPSPFNLFIRPLWLCRRGCKGKCKSKKSMMEAEEKANRKQQHLKAIQKIMAARCHKIP